MNEEKQSGQSKVLLYVIGALVLLLIAMWVWKGIAVSGIEKRVEKERAELAVQQAELEQRLRAEGDARVEKALRLMGVPLGWAVRSEAIDEDYEQIEKYAMRLLKEPWVKRVVFVGADGKVQIATDRKLQSRAASEFYGDLAQRDEIALRKEGSGDTDLVVPILGYNARLGSLIVTVSGE